MLFVVLVAVGVKSFGSTVSIFVTFAARAFPPFVPSHSLAYTVPFAVNVWVFVLFHVFPSLLVCNVYPVTVVLTVAVTLPFVHPLGL